MVVNWVDLGFQGIEKYFPSLEVIIPNKKPRGKELTLEQKAENTFELVCECFQNMPLLVLSALKRSLILLEIISNILLIPLCY
jgi:hypothetical protein